jgi:hypothetical protein
MPSSFATKVETSSERKPKRNSDHPHSVAGRQCFRGATISDSPDVD